MLKIALVGCGEVGSFVLKILLKNKNIIEERIGTKVLLKYVCDIRRIKPPKGVIYTNNYLDILNDREVNIVIELVGGYEPARTIIVESLKNGKNVVTANKAVLSKYWCEIMNISRKYNKLVYFEASVCAGVPIIQALNEGLAGNRIFEITGILNGTTNYILTQMETGLDYKEAVSNAIKLGFAEKDPSFDVNGFDSQHKLSILSSLATGSYVNPNCIFTSGVANIRKQDITFVMKFLNSKVKLLAHARKLVSGWVFEVRPFIVKYENPLSAVKNEYNAVILNGEFVGDIMLYGRGAGGSSAASAVVSDLIFLGRKVISRDTRPQYHFSNKKLKIIDVKKLKRKFLITFNVKDIYGVLAKITTALATEKVSINSLFQEESPGSGRVVPVRILTHAVEEFKVINALKRLESKDFIISINHIPLFS